MSEARYGVWCVDSGAFADGGWCIDSSLESGGVSRDVAEAAAGRFCARASVRSDLSVRYEVRPMTRYGVRIGRAPGQMAEWCVVDGKRFEADSVAEAEIELHKFAEADPTSEFAVWNLDETFVMGFPPRVPRARMAEDWNLAPMTMDQFRVAEKALRVLAKGETVFYRAKENGDCEIISRGPTADVERERIELEKAIASRGSMILPVGQEVQILPPPAEHIARSLFATDQRIEALVTLRAERPENRERVLDVAWERDEHGARTEALARVEKMLSYEREMHPLTILRSEDKGSFDAMKRAMAFDDAAMCKAILGSDMTKQGGPK